MLKYEPVGRDFDPYFLVFDFSLAKAADKLAITQETETFNQKKIVLWNIEDWDCPKELGSWYLHKFKFHQIQISPNGKFIVALSNKGKYCLIDTEAKLNEAQLKYFREPFYLADARSYLTFKCDSSSFFFACDKYEYLRFHNLKTGRRRKIKLILNPSKMSVSQQSFAVISQQTSIILIDFQIGFKRSCRIREQDAILSIDLSPSSLLIVYCQQGYLKIWNCKKLVCQSQLQMIRKLHTEANPRASSYWEPSVSFSSCQRHIVATQQQGKIINIFSHPHGKVSQQLSVKELTTIQLDRRNSIVALSQNMLKLYHLQPYGKAYKTVKDGRESEVSSSAQTDTKSRGSFAAAGAFDQGSSSQNNHMKSDYSDLQFKQPQSGNSNSLRSSESQTQDTFIQIKHVYQTFAESNDLKKNNPQEGFYEFPVDIYFERDVTSEDELSETGKSSERSPIRQNPSVNLSLELQGKQEGPEIEDKINQINSWLAFK